MKEGQLEELVGDQNPGSETPPRSKKGRGSRAKEMSGEERLPVERCRRVGVSESLGGTSSEEMTQSNTSCPQRSEVPL